MAVWERDTLFKIHIYECGLLLKVERRFIKKIIAVFGIYIS